MRGETCIRGATFLTFVALLLLIFMHLPGTEDTKVGQINVSSVPRHISMVSVDISAFGSGLENATGDPIPGLYNNNSQAPFAQQAGLRQSYLWGLYGYCAYANSSHGSCSNNTLANQFDPVDAILADTPVNYSVAVKVLISSPGTTFNNTPFLRSSSRAASYLVFIGTIFTALAMFCGIPRSTLTYLLASIFASIATILLLVGAALWSALIHQIRSINSVKVVSGAPLGVIVTFGSALWLLWAAFVILLLSLLPYVVSCHTYRTRFA